MLLSFLSISTANAADCEHNQWYELLKDNVVELKSGSVTQVDYQAFMNDHVILKNYLATLSDVSASNFESWSSDTQLAFLINAYNAWTVELILSKYPDLESIKDLGSLFSSPWKKAFIPLFGDTVSLDHIEQDLIRGHFDEPRIHFAVNCASIGCPALRAEAYQSDSLDSQLEEAAHLFLADTDRNRLKGDELQISKIFDWYQSDFEKQQTLAAYLVRYASSLNLTESQQQDVLSGKIDIEYLDYDWSLNSVNNK